MSLQMDNWGYNLSYGGEKTPMKKTGDGVHLVYNFESL